MGYLGLTAKKCLATQCFGTWSLLGQNPVLI